MRSWERTDRPIVLAHRGGADEYPENSVEAFEGMQSQGFNYIETDAHSTADGVLVLIHDPLLDRTTNGSGPISLKDWADVKELHDESGNTPMKLEDALEQFPNIDFNIDIKANSALDPMVRLLRSGRYNDRVLIASFSEKRLRRIRKHVPGIATSMGTAAVTRLFLASKAPKKLLKTLMRGVPGPRNGAVCVQIPTSFRGIPILSKDLVDLAHEHGIAVHVWTINEVKDMIEILDMGVDGIITDRPNLARNLLNTRYGEQDA